MELKDAYSSSFGSNPCEKIVKNGKEYVRFINESDLIEYSHENLDIGYIQDPLLCIASYISRNKKNFPNTVIDISCNISLSKINRHDFIEKEHRIYDKFYKKESDYDRYKIEIERFRSENLFYILTPKRESFYKNEPFIITEDIKAIIQNFHWHINETNPDLITDVLYNWKSIYKSLSNFNKLKSCTEEKE